MPGVLGGEFTRYRMVAARDGTLNVYHFSCSLDAIRKQAGLSATLRGRYDAKALRQAHRQLRAAFPNIESVRHAIAHAGELYKTPEFIRKNEQKVHHETGAPGGLLLGALNDRTFSVGYEGKVFSATLSDESLNTLIGVNAAVRAAFASASVRALPPAAS